MATTDLRNLKVKIFELIEHTPDNYSTYMEFDKTIDPNEPVALTANQVNLVNSLNMSFLNSNIVESKIDPRSNEDVRQAIKEVNAISGNVTRPSIASIKSRTANLVNSKDVILRNRFDKTKVLHTAWLSKFSANINLESKTEIKYLINYQQIFRDTDSNQIGSSQSVYTSLLALNILGVTYLETLNFTPSSALTYIYSLSNGNLIAELDTNTFSSDPSDKIVDFFNRIGAFFSERLEYKISEVKAYSQKLDFETDQRKISFNIPYTGNEAINAISSRDNSQKDFGYVIYDASKEVSLFETNSLGQEILTSDDTAILEYGYLLNFKEIEGRGLNFNGVRTLLKTSPNLMHKRYLVKGSLDLNDPLSWSVTEFAAYADSAQVTQSYIDPSGFGATDPNYLDVRMQRNDAKPSPSTDLKINYVGTQIVSGKKYRITFTFRFRLFNTFYATNLPFVMVYETSDPTNKFYVKPYPTNLSLTSKFDEDIRVAYFDFIVETSTQSFTIFASPKDSQVETYKFSLGDFIVHEVEI